MKKLLRSILLLILIVVFAILAKNGTIKNWIERHEYKAVEEYSKEIKESKYYYNKLNNEQKRIYISIVKGVNEEKKDIDLGFFTNGLDEFKECVTKAMYAYMADNAEVFYVASEYSLEFKDYLISRKGIAHIKYTATGKELKDQKQVLENKIKTILSEIIKDNMNDYEKELAIHDYLVSNIEYYSHVSMSEIPDEKHLAYSAIVKNSAVCDGIAKAFKILMNRENIDCIVTMGTSDKEPHAWNIVKLDNEYYHVDLTANGLKVDGKMLGLTTHLYFNLTDTEISKTSQQDTEFEKPRCLGTRYDYYKQTGLYIDSNLNFKGRLSNIIENSSNKNILELKITNVNEAPQMLVQYLYSLNFNNYKTKGITKINYITFNNVYVIQK